MSPGLLRQPGGFEGLVLVAVVLEVSQQAIPERGDDRQSEFGFDTALDAAPAGRPQREHPVTEIPHVRVVSPEVHKEVDKVPEEG